MHRDNVHVGIQVGSEPHELVPGDAASADWTVDIEPIERAGGVDFRGAAVHGRRGERFLYLTWGEVTSDGSFEMFRRAKLMLADLEPLIDGDSTRRVVATVDLTDEGGGPRCARLKPPAMRLA